MWVKLLARIRHRPQRGALALAASCLLATSAVGQVPIIDPILYDEPDAWHVKSNGNDTLDGKTWATAFRTIERALAVAQPDEQIWVRGLTTDVYIPLQVGTFQITKPVRLYGGFQGSETMIAQRLPANRSILDGTLGTGRAVHIVDILEISTSYVMIDGFVIQNGGNGLLNPITNTGGGINAPCVNLVLSNVIVQNCFAYATGGGLYFGGDCTIPNPDSIELPGNYPRRLSIKYCIFQDNSTDRHGGGIYGSALYGEIQNTSFARNTAGFTGGGCYLRGQVEPNVLNFVGCEFKGNMANWYDTTLVEHSGGALSLADRDIVSPSEAEAHAVVTNCTFYRNFIGFTDSNNYSHGGAISVGGISTCTVRNSIVWDNFRGSYVNNQEMLGPVDVYESDVRSDTWNGRTGIDVIQQAPVFVSTTSPYDLDLQVTSPCIDNARYGFLPHDDLDVDGDGDTAEILPRDIMRRFRAKDQPPSGILDMGAFEVP